MSRSICLSMYAEVNRIVHEKYLRQQRKKKTTTKWEDGFTAWFL